MDYNVGTHDTETLRHRPPECDLICKVTKQRQNNSHSVACPKPNQTKKKKFAVAYTQPSLTLHYIKKIFYYQYYIHS